MRNLNGFEYVIKRSCSDKRYSKSRNKAQRFVIRQANLEIEPRRLKTYKCPFCDGWHVATKPPREE